jgi:purine-binding chemotaxis protein CheW
MKNLIEVFELTGEHDREDIASSEGVFKMQPLPSLTHLPSFIEGNTNLPDTNLRQHISLSSRNDDKEIQNVMTSMNGAEVSMIVDGVFEVLTIKNAEIEPTPRIAITIDSDFITSVTRLDGQLVILLDMGTMSYLDSKD